MWIAVAALVFSAATLVMSARGLREKATVDQMTINRNLIADLRVELDHIRSELAECERGRVELRNTVFELQTMVIRLNQRASDR